MDSFIKDLFESYYSSHEQMMQSLKNADKAREKYDKEKEGRTTFIVTVLGKPLYNKCCNNGALGTFAPITWSSLKVTPVDFQEFFKVNKLNTAEDSIYKLCAFLETLMPKNNFSVRYDYVHSDLTFDTMDKIIDFFQALLKATNKTFRIKLNANEINWKPICKKFRLYFN